MVKLRLPNQIELEIPNGTTIAQLASKQGNPHALAGGILNGKVHDLNYRLNKSGAFEWIMRDSLIGQMMTERTPRFFIHYRGAAVLRWCRCFDRAIRWRVACTAR